MQEFAFGTARICSKIRNLADNFIEQANMTKISGKWIAAVVLAIAAPSVVAAVGGKGDEAAAARNLTVFNSLYKELLTRYVDTVDAEQSITTAINAMLRELDPYTEYISADERDDFMSMSTTGEYGGIGSVIRQTKNNGVVIADPYEGSPAATAGLRPGDRIIMIDNDSTLNWTVSQVSDHLKGQANTPVRVVVDRPYVEDSILSFTIVRKKIQMPSVPYYAALDNGIGYIQLTQFTETSPEEVKTALLELKKNPNVKSIVLDLRGNGGGLVESAVQIANFFVPKNTEIIRTKGREKTEERIYKTTQKPIDTEIPLCVLIDGGSASAAEIVTGAMQDLDRAVVVGTRSFGKGLVQTTLSLPFDNMVKVTTAKYYIPSGRLIQAIDYSHRSADGSAERIPDSLTTVFRTLHGREVRDGGGITPDISVDWGKISRLTYNIYVDDWAFDFATKFATEHDTIASPEQFKLSDADFAEFKQFIDPEKFNYDKVCETGLDQLRETAEIEGYMNDSTRQAFDALAKLLKHNLEQDLDNNRKAIEDILVPEILSRYYFERGRIIYSLKDDVGIEAAAKVLNDPEEYKRILSPKTESDKE